MKKSKKFAAWKWAFWLAMLAGVLWIAYAPTPHHRAPVSVQVAVEAPPEPPPKPEPPAVETPPQPPAPVAEAPPVGDEKSQPQAVTVTAPVVPSHEEIAPTLPTGAKPVIAIVIDDMGLDLKDSQRAINLPGYITLSFMPYATRLRDQTHDAHEQGHELLLHMPMEPIGHDDPGPGALLVSLSHEEIRSRFQAALASFVGFDGVNNHMGSKFTADPDGMEIVVDELQQRHLFFFDSRTSAKSVGATIARQHGLPTVSRDVFLDDDISAKAVNYQLQQTERIARRKGYAVAIGHPHAITLAALEAWLPEAEMRGFVFVPLRKLVVPPQE